MSSIITLYKTFKTYSSNLNNLIINNKMNSSNNAMSICIPRAFLNITEARVRKVFDKLDIFSIARVDMVQRKNEKGDAYQRIFVHIKDWTETADAQKAKDLLLSGKDLKIVYDDPWFWKASLNTWAPKPPKPDSLYDRKPKIRIDFGDQEKTVDKNVDAATALLNSLTLEERDRRPYAERRLDPVYCEQDVNQGFRDRRLPKDGRIKITPENVDKYIGSQVVFKNREGKENTTTILGVSKNKKTIHVDYPELKNNLEIVSRNVYLVNPVIIAPALPDIVAVTVAVAVPVTTADVKEEKLAYKMDPEMIRLLSVYFKIKPSDVTEEIYKNNAQRIRDLRHDEIEILKSAHDYNEFNIDYGTISSESAPKKKPRRVVE